MKEKHFSTFTVSALLLLFQPCLSLFYPCEDNPTDEKEYSLLEGTIHYDVISTNTAPSPNVTVAAAKLREVIDEEICNVNVRSIIYGSDIRISFFLHLLPLPTKDYQQEFDTNGLLTSFGDTSTINDIFSNSLPPTASITALKATANINECHSPSTHSCSANADCFDQTVGYHCQCKLGYKGDGYNCTVIECDLSQAPKPVAYGATVIRDPAGNVIESTTGTVPYGTTLEFVCDKYYTPTAYGSSSYAEVSGSICGGSPQDSTGWSGTDIQCTISFEFRIAIACSIVSSIVIIMIFRLFHRVMLR